MNVLVACEFSGVVRDAFRKRGHNAFSCDLIPALPGPYSQFHLQMPIQEVLKSGFGWDLMIAHPDCTYLTTSGNRSFKEDKSRGPLREKALEFVSYLMNSSIPMIAIENPIGVISTRIRKPEQIIQPWQFGHGEVKATCLWLKNLPLLEYTDIVDGRVPRSYYESPGIKNGLTRKQRRSITYLGIADAMADQWGGSL